MLVYFIIPVCILLTFAILMQNSKGGGIQARFVTANAILGIQRGTRFIEKTTWTLALALVVLIINSWN